jgi:hypothetical protein
VIEELHKNYPKSQIDISAHSLGNNVLSYGLRLMALRKQKIIRNVFHSEAAIPANVYGQLGNVDYFNNIYAYCERAIKGKIYNSFSINDAAIIEAFRRNLGCNSFNPQGVSGLLTPLNSYWSLLYLPTSVENVEDYNYMGKHYNEYFKVSQSGGLGGQAVKAICRKFHNIDSYGEKRKRTWDGLREIIFDDPRDKLDHPYNICEHSSMMYDYFYDVMIFYKSLLKPNSYILKK